MPIQYTTVYQIAQLAPDWPFACIGLLPLIGGAVILWGKRRFKWTKPHWLFSVFLCVFGFIWVGGVGSSVLVADWNVFTAYQKGDYRTVEGIVDNFHPMPYEGHQDECFSVQDQRFCYSISRLHLVSTTPLRMVAPFVLVYPSELPIVTDVSYGSTSPKTRRSLQQSRQQ
jgi:hypothetical protein